MKDKTEAIGWDTRYELGEYEHEPPVAFVDTILEDLGAEGAKKFGLYAGCGNGRNFIPLLKKGLNLQGIDISLIGLDQLVERYPEAEGRVRVSSLADIKAACTLDYLVAIQVFQHGNTHDINTNFAQARDLLKPGGKLYLRVNSASTQVELKHHQVENNKYGGFTIVYEEEPKMGAKRHFFDHQELEVIAASNNFEIVRPLVEVIESRKPPQTGTWTQWETIWQKT